MAAHPTPTATGLPSRMPYLPGLDGLRAIAVIGVMIYHANHSWLQGGYLGVEVFFVISGYLITLLLIGEHERSGSVNLVQFWKRRFRRLLPALYVMMALVAVYVAAFATERREETRGDFVAAIGYVSNWYQILVGQGYGAGEAFVPLRHLWSLAVEEQFYLVWPLVMVLLMRRARGRLPAVGLKLIAASVFITVVVAVIYVPGATAGTCDVQGFTNGWSTVAGKCINVNEALYLGSFSRAGGLLLGAGFAMLWRPMAIVRGPLRNKGRQLDLLAVLGLALIGVLMVTMELVQSQVYNPWLFRGGFLMIGFATLLVVAAASHQYALTGRLLGNPLLRWTGTRSYGLYLYHWPVYQVIREQANIKLTFAQLVLAMIITVPLTEASYRFIETPIRQGKLRTMLAGLRLEPRKLVATLTVVGLLAVAGVSLVVADKECVGAIQQSLCNNNAAADETDVSSATDPTVDTATPGETVVTTTTEPKVPQRFVAIGESVMVGAVNLLRRAGVFVDAKENRGPKGVKNTVIKLRDAGELGVGTTTVIQVGTNAPMNENDIAAIMAELPAGAGGVWFLTLKASPEWIAANNELINSLPSVYPNAQVIDWATQSQQVQLCPDDTHITCNGSVAATFYSNLILAAVGLPAIA